MKVRNDALTVDPQTLAASRKTPARPSNTPTASEPPADSVALASNRREQAAQVGNRLAAQGLTVRDASQADALVGTIKGMMQGGTASPLVPAGADARSNALGLLA